jgi:hypothetical protein
MYFECHGQNRYVDVKKLEYIEQEDNTIFLYMTGNSVPMRLEFSENSDEIRDFWLSHVNALQIKAYKSKGE